ncbi:MAG: ribonuclease Z [Chitinophagales bacterium]|nr:MAG: ribonuclease Z [Chitinophagales bacterium]
MFFSITVLGSNSALPAHGRHPTSQLLNIHDHFFLVDCGEGTQMRLEACKIRHGRIEHIFISHLHGDHFFGLIGLITSYHLNHRERPLTIFCPKGLDEIIHLQLKYSDTHLNYPLHFVHFEPRSGNVLFENDFLQVITLKLTHRIPCAGFVFREKPSSEKNIRPEKINEYHLTVPQIQQAKKGQDIRLADGRIIHNQELTIPVPPPRVYAYCTDTLYDSTIIPFIEGADLLYHEATFEHHLQQRAKETFHSTTIQAAEIALQACVKKLMIGHFSARYRHLDNLLSEARSVFPNTILAEEGKTIDIPRILPST